MSIFFKKKKLKPIFFQLKNLSSIYAQLPGIRREISFFSPFFFCYCLLYGEKSNLSTKRSVRRTLIYVGGRRM